MGLLSFIIVGLIAGWLASLIMKTRTTIWIDLILGVVGAIIGGWITDLLYGVNLVTGVNLRSIIVAVIGGIIAIALYRLIRHK